MTKADARRMLVAELSRRLRPVCMEFSQKDFDEMIEQLADITLKYDRSGGLMYDRRNTDRLIADLRDALERNKAAREGTPTSNDAVRD
jgi:hypothetical protein